MEILISLEILATIVLFGFLAMIGYKLYQGTTNRELLNTQEYQEGNATLAQYLMMSCGSLLFINLFQADYFMVALWAFNIVLWYVSYYNAKSSIRLMDERDRLDNIHKYVNKSKEQREKERVAKLRFDKLKRIFKSNK